MKPVKNSPIESYFKRGDLIKPFPSSSVTYYIIKLAGEPCASVIDCMEERGRHCFNNWHLAYLKCIELDRYDYYCLNDEKNIPWIILERKNEAD